MPQIYDKEIIRQRLSKLHDIMERDGVDVYLVMTGDYHLSEYTGAYFNEREFITGFTGSAGSAIITKDKAFLYTDGRYFTQAELQIQDTGIELMRQGETGVPTIQEFCLSLIDEGKVLAFDGRTIPARLGIKLYKEANNRGGQCRVDFDGICEIFENRPKFPFSKAYELEFSYAGESVQDKLAAVRRQMKKENADIQVVATLDDICWMYNIRGNDVECNPVIMAYSIITEKVAYLYTDRQRFDDELADKLFSAGVEIKPYDDVYKDLESLNSMECFRALDRYPNVLLDLKRINTKIFNSVPIECEVIEAENPQVLLKAIKNETEVANLKDVHIDDGVALTRFMMWIKKKMSKKETVTEVQAAEYIDGLRANIKDYIELSFDTISAYNANAAMMHYHATKDNCSKIEPHGMLLVDSGGQYLRGTTDVTRTFAMGEVTDDMKKYFTLTLKGMLSLANAKYLSGCDGFNLDILARQPLWEVGMDYRCGTGHGVGYLLNVHESPNGFRWKHIQGVNDLAKLVPGMVTSDEPGVYIEGEFGIRIENEIVVVKDYENEYGTFLRFDMLTMVPIDLELVDTKWLDDKDVDRLNAYHAQVYKTLAPHFDGEELEMLKAYTRAIQR